jgi:hypothetical protein
MQKEFGTMTLNNSTLITDSFQCPNPIFAENNMKLPYHTCINRQNKHTQYGTIEYPECASCLYGKEIKRHFKGYKPVKNQAVRVTRITKNITGTRLKKGDSLYSPHCIVKSKQTLEQLIQRVKND